MTSRERLLAAVRMQPVDRLPFWPKLDAAYPRAQSGKFRSMQIDELHEWIGSDNFFWSMPKSWREWSRGGDYAEAVDGVDMKIEYRTGRHTVTARHRWDEASQSYHPVEFPLKSVDDMPILTEWFNNRVVEPCRFRKFWPHRFQKFWPLQGGSGWRRIDADSDVDRTQPEGLN